MPRTEGAVSGTPWRPLRRWPCRWRYARWSEFSERQGEARGEAAPGVLSWERLRLRMSFGHLDRGRCTDAQEVGVGMLQAHPHREALRNDNPVEIAIDSGQSGASLSCRLDARAKAFDGSL